MQVRAGRTLRILERGRAVALLAVDIAVLETSVGPRPPHLRALDAIRVASALSLGADLLAFVTHDDRRAAAARTARLPVSTP